MNIVVLGGGMIGGTLARDLAAEPAFEVTVVDIAPRNPDALVAAHIKLRSTDLSRPRNVEAAVADCDVVVGALPSALGRTALETIIACGKPCCDISFMAEDATELDALAKSRGITVVFDCGVAPGLSNMIVGHCDAALDKTDSVAIYVGGLPKARCWPYQYKAPFAPSDVLEEYTRPVRLVENGEIVVKEALTDPELIDFPPVGTLEACNTDGLRSLIRTVIAHTMSEKTLRYPGHFELMRVLRATGFLDKNVMDVFGASVRPLDLTSRLLSAKWALEQNEAEFTIMRVVVEGQADGKGLRHTYDLYDESDPVAGNSSMARTTGFPAAIVTRLIADGRFERPGVHPPETLGREPAIMDYVFAELKRRGVRITSNRAETE